MLAGVLKKAISLEFENTNDMTGLFLLVLPCAVITTVLCVCLKKVISIEKGVLKI